MGSNYLYNFNLKTKIYRKYMYAIYEFVCIR